MQGRYRLARLSGVLLLASLLCAVLTARSVRQAYVDVDLDAFTDATDPPTLTWGATSDAFVPMDPVPPMSEAACNALYDFTITATGQSDPRATEPCVVVRGLPDIEKGRQDPQGSWSVGPDVLRSDGPADRTAGRPATFRWNGWAPDGLRLTLDTGPHGGIVTVASPFGTRRYDTYAPEPGQLSVEPAPVGVQRSYRARVMRRTLSDLRLHLREGAATEIQRLSLDIWSPTAYIADRVWAARLPEGCRIEPVLRKDDGALVVLTPHAVETGGWVTGLAAFLASLLALTAALGAGWAARRAWRRLPDTRLKRRLGAGVTNTLLMAGSVAVGLLIVEAGLRLYYYGTLSLADTRTIATLQFDARRGWALRPNNRARIRDIDYDILLTTNSKGLRDREHDYAREPGVFRIVVLGDSFMEAFQVDREEALPALLEEELRDRRVEVINLGVRAYSTAQEYLALADEGLKYHPDLVLLAFYPMNDLVDDSYELTSRRWDPELWRTAARPYPHIDAHTGALRIEMRDPVEARRAVEQQTARMRRWHGKSTSRGYLLNTVLAETCRYLYESYLPEVRTPYDPNVEFGPVLRRYVPILSPGDRLTEERYEELWSQAWEVTARCVAETNRLATSHGARFAMFVIPDIIQVDTKFRERALSRLRFLDIDTSGINNRVCEFAKTENIPCLDLLPIYAQYYVKGGRPLYHKFRDHHWNPRGHRFATTELIHFLDAQRLLPPKP